MTHPTTIGVIGGTGAEGRGLAARFAAAGLRVIVGSRHADRAAAAVNALRAEQAELPVEAATNERTIEASETVVLAVPFPCVSHILETHQGRFKSGALVIDVTVPVVFDDGRPRLLEVSEGSAAEHIRRRLPAGVSMAASLKTIPARVLNGAAPLDCDEFVCGDSESARARTMALLGLIPGLRPLDAGPLDSARTIERMTVLAITLNRRYKSRDARFRVVGLARSG